MRSIMNWGIRHYRSPLRFTHHQPRPTARRPNTLAETIPRPPDRRPLDPGAVRRLFHAVLLEALEVLRNKSRLTYSPGVYLEAQRWVLSDDDDGPFAFRNVCDVLGRDPEVTRRTLDPFLRHLPARHRLALAVGESE